MIELPIYNRSGQEVAKVTVDEALLGGEVRPALLKQALVMYQANKRQGTVATKGRGEVEGSTKKLYAQKHTDNARRGNIRTNVMKGGGMAFAKKPRDFRQSMPAKQRRLARDNAILSKIQSQSIKILDELRVQGEKPKTREIAGVLKALEISRTVLIATEGIDQNVLLATRNIANARIKPAMEMNAYDILSARTLLMTRAALDGVLEAAKPRLEAAAG